MALMNMVSSNINQWTLLAAMLPIVYSLSRGAVSAIPLDGEQEVELLMTLAQSLLGALFLLDMQLAVVGSGRAVRALGDPVRCSPAGRLEACHHILHRYCVLRVGGRWTSS